MKPSYKRLVMRLPAFGLVAVFVFIAAQFRRPLRSAQAGAPLSPVDLIISEYVEGSGNSKALEFYNGTSSAIDLPGGGYEVVAYNNGASSVTGHKLYVRTRNNFAIGGISGKHAAIIAYDLAGGRHSGLPSKLSLAQRLDGL